MSPRSTAIAGTLGLLMMPFMTASAQAGPDAAHPWRLVVSAGLEGGGTQARSPYDTAYWSSGPTVRAGMERSITRHTLARLAVGGTFNSGRSGICLLSLPPQCTGVAHTIVAVGTGVLRLRGLELEAGGGWSALMRRRTARPSPRWPASGPATFAAVSLDTRPVRRVRGFISLRHTAWIFERPVRESAGATIGLKWR